MKRFRSTLSVPGNKPRMFDKALHRGADRVCFDLEDSVHERDKDQALLNVCAFLKTQDDRSSIAVRVNNEGSRAFDELTMLLATCGNNRPMFILPKCGDSISGSVRELIDRERLQIEVIIETCMGVINAEQWARLKYVTALHFGNVDYAVDSRMCVKADYAISKTINAARAYDKPVYYGACAHMHIEALQGILCEIGYYDFDGMWAIHPNQIDTINDDFTLLDADDIVECNKVIALVDNHGTFVYDGVMMAAPHTKLARKLLNL